MFVCCGDIFYNNRLVSISTESLSDEEVNIETPASKPSIRFPYSNSCTVP